VQLPADPSAAIRQARRAPDLVVVEGFHALKHALRFGAEILRVVIASPEEFAALASAYGPDVPGRLPVEAEALAPEAFRAMAPQATATGVVSIARRPVVDVDALLADTRPAPVILLDQPRDLGNAGACVRVAAAADAAGVLTTGVHDPWDPSALRGSAGLHFALPVARIPDVRMEGGPLAGDRPLLAVDPEGELLRPELLPPRAILAFGSERRGLSAELLARADARVRLPMREGVSSLNLATSVAALLYGWRLSRSSGG